MSTINIYKNSMGTIYTQNNSNTINSIDNNSKERTEDNKITSSADNIEISQKNENIINTKKAYDTFNETCDQIGEVTWDGYVQSNMALYFNTIAIDMRDRGVHVPDFALDGKNTENTNYVGFVDKIKDYANSLLENKEVSSLPSKFFEFCDVFKENLIKNGCK